MKNKTIHNWDELPVLLDVNYMSLIFKVSELTVRRWAEQGKIEGRKTGHKWMFDKEHIRSMFSETEVTYG